MATSFTVDRDDTPRSRRTRRTRDPSHEEIGTEPRHSVRSRVRDGSSGSYRGTNDAVPPPTVRMFFLHSIPPDIPRSDTPGGLFSPPVGTTRSVPIHTSIPQYTPQLDRQERSSSPPAMVAAVPADSSTGTYSTHLSYPSAIAPSIATSRYPAGTPMGFDQSHIIIQPPTPMESARPHTIIQPPTSMESDRPPIFVHPPPSMGSDGRPIFVHPPPLMGSAPPRTNIEPPTSTGSARLRKTIQSPASTASDRPHIFPSIPQLHTDSDSARKAAPPASFSPAQFEHVRKNDDQNYNQEWDKLAAALLKFDQNMIKDRCENIDTLLVFVSCFYMFAFLC